MHSNKWTAVLTMSAVILVAALSRAQENDPADNAPAPAKTLAKSSVPQPSHAQGEFTPPLFPMGPYIYGTTNELTARAAARGMTLPELLDANAKDVAAHGGNTIYYANLATDPETFIMAVKAAQKHGVSVFAQLNGALYLRPGKGQDYFEKNTKPLAEKILSQYKGLEGVLGWMGSEEAPVSGAPLVIEYRKLCKQIDPTHNLFTLYNHLDAFQADNDAYAEWYGFDRYSFKLIGEKNTLSMPREVVSILSTAIAPCYEEATRRGRPLICVGQSWTFQNEFKTRMEPKSGYREVSPGVWRGWGRYVPEHAMTLQLWLAISQGAKGSLWYHYYSATQGRGKEGVGMGRFLKEICLVDEQGNESPHWKELGQGFHEIKPLTPLFLAWRKAPATSATNDSAWVKVSAFTREPGREKYYVVFNTRIAEWDGTTPTHLSNSTKVHFDDNGLAGIEKVGDLECRFTPEGKDRLWDVLTAKKLAANDDGSYTVRLPPGKGIVLMQGNDDDAAAATAWLKTKQVK